MNADAAKGRARRRLVRGVFAAPVALTLYSGSVAAVSVSCVAKQADTPITPTDGDATFLRVPLYKSTSSGALFVRYEEIHSLMAPGEYLATTKSQLVVGPHLDIEVGDIIDTPSDLEGPTSEYVAVSVDADGFIGGVFIGDTATPGGATALHTTCWMSFGGMVPETTTFRAPWA